MPQDSRPPDFPSAQEVAEGLEGEPFVDQRHVDVRRALQDIVLFAQDFMDVLDDLAEEPIVPLEIFFLQADRAAGRFAGPGRRHHNFRRPAGQPYQGRQGMLERRLAGGNFRGPQRLQRPPFLLGRPVRPEGNLGQPVPPRQPPADLPMEQIPGERPDLDEPRERPVLEGDEPIRPAVVEADQGRPAVVEADQGRPAVVEADQGRPAGVEADQGRPADVEAEADMPADVEADQGRPADVEAEPDMPADVEADPSRPADVEAVPGMPADVEVEQGRPLAMEVEAAGSATPRVETGGLHRPTPHEKYRSPPEQVKRARLDIAEVGCSEQNKERGADDKPMEVVHDSSESNGEE